MKELLEALDLLVTKIDDAEVTDEVRSTVTAKINEKFKPSVTEDLVKEFIKTNDSGKTLIKEFVDTKSIVDEFKKSDDYKNEVETVKKTVAKETEERVRKALDKTLTPEQKEIKELNDRLAKTEDAIKQKDLLIYANSILEENKLPKALVDFVRGEDEIATLENVKKIKTTFDDLVKTEVDAKFKALGGAPKIGGGSSGDAVTQKMLEDLHAKAKQSGRIEDRVKYAEAKRAFAEQQSK